MAKNKQPVIGTCALCKKENVVLEESHIIPKFVTRKQKADSVNGRLRNGMNPNVVVQDGAKEYLLCGECEDLFSKVETKFSRAVFYPFVDGTLSEFEYDEWLNDFIVSVNWRNLIVDMEGWEKTLEPKRLKVFKKKEEVLRKYLLGKRNFLFTIENHIFFFNDIKEISGIDPSQVRMHTFFRHGQYGYSFYADNGYYIVTNMLGLLIVTILKKNKGEQWINTKVRRKGKFDLSTSQHIKSQVLADMLDYMEEERKKRSMLSETQRNKIAEELKKNPEKFLKSKYYKDMQKDNALK